MGTAPVGMAPVGTAPVGMATVCAVAVGMTAVGTATVGTACTMLGEGCDDFLGGGGGGGRLSMIEEGMMTFTLVRCLRSLEGGGGGGGEGASPMAEARSGGSLPGGMPSANVTDFLGSPESEPLPAGRRIPDAGGGGRTRHLVAEAAGCLGGGGGGGGEPTSLPPSSSPPPGEELTGEGRTGSATVVLLRGFSLRDLGGGGGGGGDNCFCISPNPAWLAGACVENLPVVHDDDDVRVSSDEEQATSSTAARQISSVSMTATNMSSPEGENLICSSTQISF